MAHESYFTDFTGKIFRFYLDDQGNGKVPHDLREYLFNNYNIIKHEFIPSLHFMYTECAINLVNYIESLHEDEWDILDNLYVIGPCYKEPQLTTIDYQAVISGTPYYVGSQHFDESKVEPPFDTMKREVKEETFLTLHGPVNNYDICFFKDTFLSQVDDTTKFALDYDNIDIYGNWSYHNGIPHMTSKQINDIEHRLSIYKQDRDFRRKFNQHKIALILIGNLATLYNFYGRDISFVNEPPHMKLRSNDFGVVLIPLNLVYNICKKILV